MGPEIWCVTDGRTDGQREKVTYRGGHPPKKEAQNIKAYKKFVFKETTVKRCLLILDLKPFRS